MKDNTKIETYTTKINNKIAIDKICFFLEILGLKDLVINKSKRFHLNCLIMILSF